MIRQLDDKVMVSGQLAPHEVAGLAEQGVTMLVNNRPDGEEPGQPLAGEIEDAAAAAGIGYRFVPIIRGIGPADVEFDAGGAARSRRRQAARLLPLGHALGAGDRAGEARGRRLGRRGHRAAQPGRFRSRPDRAFALGPVVPKKR